MSRYGDSMLSLLQKANIDITNNKIKHVYDFSATDATVEQPHWTFISQAPNFAIPLDGFSEPQYLNSATPQTPQQEEVAATTTATNTSTAEATPAIVDQQEELDQQAMFLEQHQKPHLEDLKNPLLSKWRKDAEIRLAQKEAKSQTTHKQMQAAAAEYKSSYMEQRKAAIKTRLQTAKYIFKFLTFQGNKKHNFWMPCIATAVKKTCGTEFGTMLTPKKRNQRKANPISEFVKYCFA